MNEDNPFKEPLEKLILNSDKTLTLNGVIILIMASYSLIFCLIKAYNNKNKK